MGHLHYHVRDVEANKRFWVSLGGVSVRIGSREPSAPPEDSPGVKKRNSCRFDRLHGPIRTERPPRLTQNRLFALNIPHVIMQVPMATPAALGSDSCAYAKVDAW